MKRIGLFVLVIVCCPRAGGQGSTAGDPFGLKAFGFGDRQEKRTLIKPAGGPSGARECGAGVYVREETAFAANNKAKKVKVVTLYFRPDPATLAAFGDWLRGKEPPTGPATSPSNSPAGVSSFTFFWPPRSWPPQQATLTRAEKVGDRVVEAAASYYVVFASRESDSPTILWTNETPRSVGLAGPELLGKRISADPLLFKLSFPRGAKRCVEGK